MAFTSHGHQIAGTTAEATPPVSVARCGGPGLCAQCSREAASSMQNQFNNHKAVQQAYDPNVAYQETARRIVQAYALSHMHRRDTDKGATLAFEDVYVVWFSKTLQNWKALVSTTLLDGMYYEVTSNGDKQEVYLDAYKKFDNVCYSFTKLVDLADG